MKRMRVWRNWSLILAAGFAVFTLLALGLVLSWRASDQSRLEEGRLANCVAIEEHKRLHREEAAFDPEGTERLLRDLNIDLDSERGQRLFKQAREQAAAEQTRFAPAEC